MLLLALLIEGAFGGGDIKLCAVCGFLLGWKAALLALFIAVLTAGGLSVYLLASKKASRGAKIPFGPHLCLGVAISLYFAPKILSLYSAYFNTV
jgi:leader peptidase (prepilin peptidase)/N-methyltransferase